MPPGSKKRKAAKKKRYKQFHLDSPTNSSGNGGIDKHDGEGDTFNRFQGEIGSPSSSDSKENNHSRDGFFLVEGKIEVVGSDLDSTAHPCSDLDSTALVIDRTMEGLDSGDGENKKIAISEENGVSQVEEELVLSSVSLVISENEKIRIDHVQSSNEAHGSSQFLEEKLRIESIENPSEGKLESLVDTVDVESPVNGSVPVVLDDVVSSSKESDVPIDDSGVLEEREVSIVNYGVLDVVSSWPESEIPIDGAGVLDVVSSLKESEVPVDNSGVLDVVSSSKGSEEILVSSSVKVQSETISPDTAKNSEEGVQCGKDSVEPEISEHEIVLAPKIARPASWRNCFGLLDCIMGSRG